MKTGAQGQVLLGDGIDMLCVSMHTSKGYPRTSQNKFEDLEQPNPIHLLVTLYSSNIYVLVIHSGMDLGLKTYTHRLIALLHMKLTFPAILTLRNSKFM